MDIRRLQPILDYKLTLDEALAFKIALMWEDLARKHFPTRKGTARISKGDPRKCSLFRQCWKLMRETRGLLKENEYKLYIEANLIILKLKGGHLSPNVLCGDKAWIRWKVWKRLFDKKVANGESTTVFTDMDQQVIKQLDKSKRFLFEKYDGVPSFEKLQGFFDNKSLKIWVMSNKISYYYLVMSEWVKKLCSIEFMEQDYNFDSKVYTSKINQSIKEYFTKEFGYEN